MPNKPTILGVKSLAQTRIFKIEEVSLEFSNGAQRQFERINSGTPGAVMVIPLVQDEVIMVREYAVGAEQYELGFVKGLIDAGESPSQAADRELKEEIGYGAKSIQQIRKTRIIPHYNTALGYLMLAQDLYPEQRQGDEPEPLTRVPWKLSEINALLTHPEISDVRTLHALYWLRDYIAQ